MENPYYCKQYHKPAGTVIEEEYDNCPYAGQSSAHCELCRGGYMPINDNEKHDN